MDYSLLEVIDSDVKVRSVFLAALVACLWRGDHHRRHNAPEVTWAMREPVGQLFRTAARKRRAQLALRMNW